MVILPPHNCNQGGGFCQLKSINLHLPVFLLWGAVGKSHEKLLLARPARAPAFGSWLQFWPKCASHWKRWKSDYLAKLRRRDVLIGVPLSKWMDFQLGFFARKLAVGITRHLSALGVLGLAGKLHIRRARSSNFHPFQKFTSLSTMEIKFHIIVKLKGDLHWFVETSSHLSWLAWEWNYCSPWNFPLNTKKHDNGASKVLFKKKPIDNLRSSLKSDQSYILQPLVESP